jgi:hypothetical protein
VPALAIGPSFGNAAPNLATHSCSTPAAIKPNASTMSIR